VFAVRGTDVIAPTVFDEKDGQKAEYHYQRVCARMRNVIMEGDQDPGWSVRKVLAVKETDDGQA